MLMMCFPRLRANVSPVNHATYALRAVIGSLIKLATLNSTWMEIAPLHMLTVGKPYTC
jgi:hypothetical protein